MDKKLFLIGVFLLSLSITPLTSCSSDKTSVINDKAYTYVDDTKASLYFGKYPQSKVNDNTLIESLNNNAGTLPTSEDTYKWTDYGYYEKGTIKSYMYYIDIDQDKDGLNDYRGVYFTQYRPSNTETSSLSSYIYQSYNGYSTNTVYWFKYEPIKWDILKLEDNKALIISDLILDSQDYFYNTNNRNNIEDYQGNSSTSTIYPNNYMYSHIRSWLNTTFYQTAFTTLEQQIIEIFSIDNSGSSTAGSRNKYLCDNTNDKMFILSYKEANTYYSSNDERISKGSDYAKSQGLYVSNTNSYYYLRSPNCRDSEYVRIVSIDGKSINSYNHINDTSIGVRTTCWISL